MVSAQPSTRTKSSSLNGMEMIVGDNIIMPSDQRRCNNKVDDEERQKDQEPDLERRLEFAGDEGGKQDGEGNVLRRGEGLGFGKIGKQLQIRFARLLRHEAVEDVARTRNGFLDGNLTRTIRVHRLIVDRIDRRPHHEERQEKRKPHQHLIGRRLLQAQRLTQE